MTIIVPIPHVPRLPQTEYMHLRITNLFCDSLVWTCVCRWFQNLGIPFQFVNFLPLMSKSLSWFHFCSFWTWFLFNHYNTVFSNQFSQPFWQERHGSTWAVTWFRMSDQAVNTESTLRDKWTGWEGLLTNRFFGSFSTNFRSALNCGRSSGW